MFIYFQLSKTQIHKIDKCNQTYLADIWVNEWSVQHNVRKLKKKINRLIILTWYKIHYTQHDVSIDELSNTK